MKRTIGRAAGMLIYARDATGDRGSAQGRAYGISSQTNGLIMSLAEWRGIIAVIERDALRDSVPRVSARRKRKRTIVRHRGT
jgi:hypothetical protein